MSRQSGRGGMGNTKHRTSGKAGHNADKQQMARDVNRLAERTQHLAKGYESIDELMKDRRKR